MIYSQGPRIPHSQIYSLYSTVDRLAFFTTAFLVMEGRTASHYYMTTMFIKKERGKEG